MATVHILALGEEACDREALVASRQLARLLNGELRILHTGIEIGPITRLCKGEPAATVPGSQHLSGGKLGESHPPKPAVCSGS
jgi:hypothetical protein